MNRKTSTSGIAPSTVEDPLLTDAAGSTTLEHPCWDGLVIDLSALWR